MEVILIVLVLVLIVFMALCWVKSDKLRELQEKYLSVSKENKRLRQRNYCLEAENIDFRNNANGNRDITCYTCGGNGECKEGCRFTPGSAGCRKYWRQE